MTGALATECGRAVHVLTADGRTLRAGRASVFILGELGWRRAAWLLSKRPLIWAVEFGYRVVADHRDFFSRLLIRS